MNRNTFTLAAARRARLSCRVASVIVACGVGGGALAQKSSLAGPPLSGESGVQKVSASVTVSDSSKQLKRPSLRESLQSQVPETPKPVVSVHYLNTDQRARLREDLRQQLQAAPPASESQPKTACSNECQEKP